MGEAGEAREEAPDGQSCGNHFAAGDAVGEASEGDAKDGVEDDKGGGAQECELEVAEVHFLFNGGKKDIDKGAVHKVQQVDQTQ